LVNNLTLANNLSVLYNHIDSLVETSTGTVYWKDKNSVYLGINKEFLTTANTDSMEKVIGRSDLDMIWQQQAASLVKNDQEVMVTGATKVMIEHVASATKPTNYYCSHKTPLCGRNGNIIGVIGVSYALDDIDSIYAALNDITALFNPSVTLQVNKLAAMFADSLNFKLSKRQVDCLFYLVKGKTMKQIASILGLSYKTVEHYLETVKNKLSCHSRAELIAKALTIPAIKDRL
jgi:DNA-binding CsgD family transcriptional regulator